MAPLWLPRSVPSAWCVPAIEPRPKQTAQTILGSSCTRRQGMRGVVQSGAPRVGTGCSGCHKWIYQRADRRVGDALAAAEYGCCPVLLPEEAGSDACCLRCMLCASECLEALPCSSHTCHVYASGGITIQRHMRGVTRVAVLVAWARGTRRGSDLLRAWRRRGQPAHIMYAQR